MDSRERYNDPEECLRTSFGGQQTRLWTALPGIIQSFDPEKMTVTVQPSIQAVLRSSDPQGTISYVTMPLLVDCPVCFQGGGGFTATFPLREGDECLVVFASRCIDAWWQSGGVQPPAEIRMHDLSDGFALPGVRSVPRALPAVSLDSVQLRADDGGAYIEINQDGQVKISAPDVRVHASRSYGQDVNGYGSILTHTGGNNFKQDNYVLEAIVTSEDHLYNPPEIP